MTQAVSGSPSTALAGALAGRPAQGAVPVARSVSGGRPGWRRPRSRPASPRARRWRCPRTPSTGTPPELHQAVERRVLVDGVEALRVRRGAVSEAAVAGPSDTATSGRVRLTPSRTTSERPRGAATWPAVTASMTIRTNVVSPGAVASASAPLRRRWCRGGRRRRSPPGWSGCARPRWRQLHPHRRDGPGPVEVDLEPSGPSPGGRASRWWCAPVEGGEGLAPRPDVALAAVAAQRPGALEAGDGPGGRFVVGPAVPDLAVGEGRGLLGLERVGGVVADVAEVDVAAAGGIGGHHHRRLARQAGTVVVEQDGPVRDEGSGRSTSASAAVPPTTTRSASG